jgi:putative transcriptional regulator
MEFHRARRWRAAWLAGVALPLVLGIIPSSRPALAARAAAPAAGMFLVAQRGLRDPNFRQGVVLIVKHGPGGTFGLIVNRATEVKLGELLPDLKGADRPVRRVFVGGPVGRNQLMLLMRKATPGENIERVVAGIYFSADRDVLEGELARGAAEADLRLYAGHAGWAPGQLAYELARGDWHVTKANAGLVFGADTDALWDRLIRGLEPSGLEVRGAPARPVTG